MANNIEVSAKSGAKFQIEMSNEQTTFVPHWLVRFTDDFVADVAEKTAITDRNSFITVLVNAVNKTYGTELVADEYDFGAKYNRANPKPERIVSTRTAKADSGNSLSAYVEAIKTALDKKQTEITANPEMKPVAIKALRGFIKGGYGLSDQTVDQILLNDKIKNHPAIEKVELSL